jgi:hypothetical protein
MRKLMVAMFAFAVILTACGQKPVASAGAEPPSSTATTTTQATTTSTPSTTTSSSTTTSTSTSSTTSTTLPPWDLEPYWCNDPAEPGAYFTRDVLGDVDLEGGEYAFTFIRVLEILDYNEFLFESDRFGSWELGFWKIRASVLEQGAKIYDGEFTIGTVALNQTHPANPDKLVVDLDVTPLTGTRVPFDNCAEDQIERERLMVGRPIIDANTVVQEILEVGRVYGVGILIEYDNEIPADDGCQKNTSWCELVRGTVAYNRQLFNALENGDLEALGSLDGWGNIERVFVPAGWYDFSAFDSD